MKKIKLKRSEVFLLAMSVLFLLHVATFPSTYHIITDETLYLNLSKSICSGDFSDYTAAKDRPMHGPLMPVLLCATSPIHKFNLDNSGIVSFMLMLLMVAGWYYSIPKKMKIDKQKFALLLFGNNLLWIYSTRTLFDAPLATFLSLGILNLFLFFKYRKKSNYYLGALSIALASFIRADAFISVPILGIYVLYKNIRKFREVFDINVIRNVVKDGLLLMLPLLPYLLFIIAQQAAGQEGLATLLVYFINVFKSTRPSDRPTFTSIPYANLPIFVYIAGIFGFGVFALIPILRNRKKINKDLKDFLMLSLILYAVWEFAYLFLIFASVPRYHITLIPFFSLAISEGFRLDKKSKYMGYLYYATLLYVVGSGFIMSYYFHVATETAIWKNTLNSFISTIKSW